DIAAVFVHVGKRRSRQHPAARALDARSECLVVAVEQRAEGWLERELAEDQLLKEPRRMREVPLRRAGIGHRLDELILDRERGTQLERACAHLSVPCGELIAVEHGRFLRGATCVPPGFSYKNLAVVFPSTVGAAMDEREQLRAAYEPREVEARWYAFWEQ